jgi:hypothetical protein
MLRILSEVTKTPIPGQDDGLLYVPEFPGIGFHVVLTDELKREAAAAYQKAQQEQEHVILVAFDVQASTRRAAHELLVETLVERINPVLTGGTGIDSWWVAEDDRTDHSDCDSAIFVPLGMQATAQAALDRLTGKEDV